MNYIIYEFIYELFPLPLCVGLFMYVCISDGLFKFIFVHVTDHIS